MNNYIYIWLRRHGQAFFYSLGQYTKNPVNNILTTMVIGIALAFPAGFIVFLDNVSAVSSSLNNTVELNLFLDMEVNEKQATALKDRLATHNDIKETILIKNDEALSEYKKLSGFDNVLDALDENPFPHLILVKPEFNNVVDTKVTRLVNELIEIPEVENIQYDSKWINRLVKIIDIVKLVVLILSALLVTAVLLIIGNTIRLSIYNNRDEIEITKLFGGSDSFIQRPFLYSGFWYGVFGSFVAWLLVIVSISILDAPIKKLSGLYETSFQLSGLGIANTLFLFGIGIFLGLIGSWISVKRHLSSIEP
ncbi:MAG: permease-like cell division protein FtsX [Gammaproteobacteria bacterium]